MYVPNKRTSNMWTSSWQNREKKEQSTIILEILKLLS